jgi:HNH endonuclease
MNPCIYCRADVPADVPREHVIPQSFGVFKPDLTLDCVCKTCNHYFGSTLEWPMLNQSIEGALRLQFGLKGVVGGIGTKGVMPTVAEGDDWKGARTAIRTNQNGKQRTEVLPQIGARRTASDEFEWCLAHEVTVEFAQRYPKGSEFRIVGGEDAAENDRLVQKLIAVCPTFIFGGTKEPPFDGDGKVMLHIEHQVNRVVARCICKIAFNYMALTCGEKFASSRENNDTREFIRNDVGNDTRRVFVKAKPIIAQEIITGERGTDGHVLTIEGCPKDRTLEVQLALFNSVPYQIPITREYIGHGFAKGHHFNLHTGKVEELRTKYAGPDFDPSKLTW